MSESPPADPYPTWRRLVEAFPGTGLWPLVIDMASGSWPQDGDVLDTAEREIDALDPELVLRRHWDLSYLHPEDEDEDEDPRMAPYGVAFPGLAAVGTIEPEADIALELVRPRTAPRLGLVPCRRPADAAALSGWPGAINPGLLPAELSAVLRSWEDRFGTTLFGLGADTVTLLVARPPRTLGEALGVAAEQFALNSELVSQGNHTVRAPAEDLLAYPGAWSFWWD